MATYAPSKEISKMTEEERELHYQAVCDALGLDPRKQLLKYTMMEKGDGSGERHLVLYATKGATDALRDIHGVEVDGLTTAEIRGAVVVTASGKNKQGRRDMAIGSAVIEGKSGKTLENAFMIAQTRASRRLTLQFTGSGLLDESEISNDKTVSLVNADLPLSEIGRPVPNASGEPGKDITIKLPEAATVYPVPNHVGLNVEVPTGASVTVRKTSVIEIPEPIAPVAEVKSSPAAVTPKEEKYAPNPAAGLKPVSPTVMAAPDAVAPVKPAPQTDDKVGPNAEQMTTRRKRRTKAEMEAARAAEVQAAPEVTSSPVADVAPPATPVSAPPPSAVSVPSDIPGQPAEVVSQPATDPTRTVPMIGTAPTEEQRKVNVERLNKFRDQCVATGMVPSHGMGPTKKIREFLKVVNRGSDLNNLTVEQWDNTFRFLETTVKEHGMKDLVAFMEAQIGATDAPAAA